MTEIAKFWRNLAKQDSGYIGVLISEEISSLFVPGVSHFIRRTEVVLKHSEPDQDREIYRVDEVPDFVPLTDNITAFERWIETARTHDVPAVYQLLPGYKNPVATMWWDGFNLVFGPRWKWLRGYRSLRILSPEYVELFRTDPSRFVRPFFNHARTGKSLPKLDDFD